MASLVARLAQRSGPVVVVSSGAIALGRGATWLDMGGPDCLLRPQAAAAVGQIHLAAACFQSAGTRNGTCCRADSSGHWVIWSSARRFT